jgi:phosphopantothenoylcysteine decarboxylase/phosphopantothenate--cysteine ligase
VTYLWDPSFRGVVHVHHAAVADVVTIVPATADVLARLAQGRADDVVTALALCARGPVLAAPAMHPRMWGHPAVQRNVADLAAQGRVTLVGPVEGEVASGEVGAGRMAEPAAIVGALEALAAPKDLRGVRIAVTAGPTLEDVDPVRFIGNRSSGKMGFAVAARAAARGAQVTLVAGPVTLATPAGVRRVDVRSAASMQAALADVMGGDLAGVDALVMAAAVADYRPAAPSATKMKRGEAAASIALARNPDLLAEIGARRAGVRPALVGFAVETGDQASLVAYARRKLTEKRVDVVVANQASESFDRDDNVVTLVSAAGDESLKSMSKGRLADVILDRVKALLGR